MTQVQVPSVAGSLDDRMRSVAEAVRRELLALVDQVAGRNVRPTTLSRMLGIVGLVAHKPTKPMIHSERFMTLPPA